MPTKYPAFTIIMLSILLIASCCKPPEKEMRSVMIPNRYTGLESLYARMAANDTVTIVCYGNSITYGGGITYPQVFQDSLRAFYKNPNITVVNEGHPGWTTEMAAGALGNMVLPHQPDMVTLIFGINDLYQEKGLENYEDNLSSMVSFLKHLGIPMVVMSPTPLNNAANNGLIEYCNTADAVATEYDVAFFNMHYAMVERIKAETDTPATLMPDEVHYTDYGYQLIGEELIRYWQYR